MADDRDGGAAAREQVDEDEGVGGCNDDGDANGAAVAGQMTIDPPLPSPAAPLWSSAGSDLHEVAELCHYIRLLEDEKRELLDQARRHAEDQAALHCQLDSATQRIAQLEATRKADDTSAAVRGAQQLLQVEAALDAERVRSAQSAAQVAELQRSLDETERARQHAVFKMSELQAALSTATHARRLQSTKSTPSGMIPERMDDAVKDPTTGSSERWERCKREIELLHQKLALRDAQANEKQKLAVEVALRSAHLEHAAALEKVQLECEMRLSAWRHDETARAKEIQAAMDEDRYSIRLEMKHGMQRAQINQRVYYLQAQAVLAHQESGASGAASDDALRTLDEVLVRMQLELLRTRRFAALQKALLIRRAKTSRAQATALSKWRTIIRERKMLQQEAVLHMERFFVHTAQRNMRVRWLAWRSQTKLASMARFQAQTMACWNRLLAVERMQHHAQHIQMCQLSARFHRWRRNAIGAHSATASPCDPSNTSEASAVTANAAGSAALQDEIRKLHEQLASSKSEAWRYKRQLLKQFL